MSLDKSSELNLSEDRVVIGKLGAPFGVKGWLKLHSYAKPIENIFNYTPWYIQHAKQPWCICEVADHAVHHNHLVVLLKGINNREEAALWVNATIAIERTSLPPLPQGQYYWTDLMGLEVFNKEGHHLGVVSYLYDLMGQTTLEIESKAYGSLTIPFILGNFVLQVDLAAKRMTVDWSADRIIPDDD